MTFIQTPPNPFPFDNSPRGGIAVNRGDDAPRLWIRTTHQIRSEQPAELRLAVEGY